MNISYDYNIKGDLVNEGLFIPKKDLERLLIKIELLKMQKLKLPDKFMDLLNIYYLELRILKRKIEP